jgi:DNA-binding MarR family transcriptional regulator
LTQLADKIKEALEAGRSGQYAKKTPYERFGFSQNPFRSDVDPDDPEFLVAREDVLLEFAIQVGNAIRLFEEDPVSPFRHLLTHGLRGSGKSSLARHFDREWGKIGFQDYETLFADLSAWQEPLELQEQYGSSVKTLETYEKFLARIKQFNKPLIIFIDELDYTITGTPAIPRIKQFISDIEYFAQYGVIIIGFVNSLTLTVLLDSDPKILARSFLSFFNPEYFFFPVFSKSEIRKLLTQRLRVTRNPMELFSTKALDLIADYSLGLPIVALRIATDCLNELIIRNTDKANKSIVDAVINQFGYIDALKIVETVEKGGDEDNTSLITPKRKDVIAAVLYHQLRERYFFPATGVDGLRSSDLAELFGVNLSTMNYHLKPLTSLGPIPLLQTNDDIHDARSKIFSIEWTSHIAHALEIITVYQRLQGKQYRIKTTSIFSPRRRES